MGSTSDSIICPVCGMTASHNNWYNSNSHMVDCDICGYRLHKMMYYHDCLPPMADCVDSDGYHRFVDGGCGVFCIESDGGRKINFVKNFVDDAKTFDINKYVEDYNASVEERYFDAARREGCYDYDVPESEFLHLTKSEIYYDITYDDDKIFTKRLYLDRFLDEHWGYVVYETGDKQYLLSKYPCNKILVPYEMMIGSDKYAENYMCDSPYIFTRPTENLTVEEMFANKYFSRLEIVFE